MDRTTCLACQILEQGAVGGRKALTWSAWSQYEFTHLLALRDERKPNRIVLRRSVGGRNRPLLSPFQANRRIGELEGLGDGLDNGRQHSFGGQRRLQALPQPGEDAVRLVAVPIH